MVLRPTLALVHVLVISHAFAQVPPVIEWRRSLGGSGIDVGTSLAADANGGYAAFGWSMSNNGDVTGNHGNADYWLVKLDAAGTTVWQQCYGGTADEQGWGVERTADGGFVMVGHAQSLNGNVTGNHGMHDMWVVKADITGTLQWQKSLGGSALDYGYSIQQTNDGGYVATGTTMSNDGDVSLHHGQEDGWVVKLDASGALQWERALGGSDVDELRCVQQTADGGYVAAGFTRSVDGDVSGQHGLLDAWVVRLDASGTLLWQRALGGTNHDLAYSIIETNAGGFIAVGSSMSTDGDVTNNQGEEDFWVVALDATGDVVWQRTLGGSLDDIAYTVRTSVDGNLLVSGRSKSNDGDVPGNQGDFDYWLVKLEPDGTPVWGITLGGSVHDVAYGLVQHAEGAIAITGNSVSSDGDVIGNHGQSDYWVLRLEDIDAGMVDQQIAAFTLAPVPCHDQVSVTTTAVMRNATLTLTDMVGRTVYREGMNGTTHTVDLHDRSPGVYVITLRCEQGVRSERLIIE